MEKIKITVLLIEDDLDDASLIQRMLAETGEAFELLHTRRLATGLERLDEDGMDVLLLDLSLPDGSGLDTFVRAYAHAPSTPIVVLSDPSDEPAAFSAVQQGAQDYLIKGQMNGYSLVRTIDHAIERKRIEEALQKRNRELSLINWLGQTLTATLDFRRVAELLLEVATKIADAEGASVWLQDEQKKEKGQNELVCQVAARYGHKRSIIDLRLCPGQGIAGWVAETGESVFVTNVEDDPRFFRGIDEQIGFRTASLLAVPLRARGEIVGVLEVVNKRHGDFGADDLALLETLVSSAAIAIDNAWLVAALRRRAAELEARNEELDAFAHTVAHDLKGPLGHIVGFAEVLELYHGDLEDDQVLKYLHTIVRGGLKMNNIVDELLLLSSLRSLDMEGEPLNMADIVADAQNRLAYLIEEYEAEVISPASWPVALGYGPWVEEIWANYLSNAIKYGGQPPRVELGARTQADGRVRFWVRDNGRGLSPEEQARLFTPFTRLDQVRAKGHGLGLSIVRRIVTKLGGQAGVESEIGQGSLFYFTLPGAESS